MVRKFNEFHNSELTNILNIAEDECIRTSTYNDDEGTTIEFIRIEGDVNYQEMFDQDFIVNCDIKTKL